MSETSPPDQTTRPALSPFALGTATIAAIEDNRAVLNRRFTTEVVDHTLGDVVSNHYAATARMSAALPSGGKPESVYAPVELPQSEVAVVLSAFSEALTPGGDYERQGMIGLKRSLRDHIITPEAYERGVTELKSIVRSRQKLASFALHDFLTGEGETSAPGVITEPVRIQSAPMPERQRFWSRFTRRSARNKPLVPVPESAEQGLALSGSQDAAESPRHPEVEVEAVPMDEVHTPIRGLPGHVVRSRKPVSSNRLEPAVRHMNHPELRRRSRHALTRGPADNRPGRGQSVLKSRSSPYVGRHRRKSSRV